VDYHFVREKVLNQDISIAFISTTDQIADVFTKGLSTTRFLFLKSKLKVISSPISLWEDAKLCDAVATLATHANEDSATQRLLAVGDNARVAQRLLAVGDNTSPIAVKPCDAASDSSIVPNENATIKGMYHDTEGNNHPATRFPIQHPAAYLDVCYSRKTRYSTWKLSSNFNTKTIELAWKAAYTLKPGCVVFIKENTI
jgi:hypothetical protein